VAAHTHNPLLELPLRAEEESHVEETGRESRAHHRGQQRHRPGPGTAQRSRRFVAEGAHVFITGRRQAELDEAVRQIGKHVTGVRGDVANLADLDRLFATVKQQQGRLDVLFANAGVPAMAPLGSITEEHFDKIFNINVKGLLFTVQKALPLFPDGGSIILNASIAASKGLEAISVYSATKAAARSFARCLGHRPETPPDPRQRHQPRIHRNAHLQQGGGRAGPGR
jgi:hypothetical protein